MKPSVVLALALSLLLAGCGGAGNQILPIDEPKLGTAAMDLALSGGFQDTPKTMAGTGSARGEVTVVSTSGNGVAITEVKAVLASTKIRSDGQRLTQTLLLHLNVPATLAAGATFALDGAMNSAEYDQTWTAAQGATYGDRSTVVAMATRGTVEVMSLADGVATLRLTGTSFAIQGLVEPSSLPPVLVSGTVMGRVVAAFDMG